ncbi:MAG: DUF1501 domain-containing protein [Verrucomicrobia bacterium]|nr:DUF1501 domain-containing protein [Verrucomicrobiota bacterium]MDA1065016.1 DUF1501 domain-containing protein [Verrucomicrobiota bacterium]
MKKLTRRDFMSGMAGGIGTMALGNLLGIEPSLPPRVKRVIFLFQSGGPSQMDLFDHKPELQKIRATELPDSIRQGQRFTGMTATQSNFPVVPSMFNFARHGQSQAWVSDLLPHTAKIVDDLCFIRTMKTEAINHDPAITFFQTGFQLAGRPSIGSWLSYGLGSENKDLPAFIALISGNGGQPLYDRLWGSGFLPSKFQGVKFRSTKDPVLYLSNPEGVDAQTRRRMIDDVAQLNEMRFKEFGDPEIQTRIAQYEMAYRMQSSVPELTDVTSEPDHVFDLYGEDARKPGTYAYNCLMARRMSERGVRFVQLFHRGWDNHTELPEKIRTQCKDTDQASAALVTDLKQRGMLDDTLVVWGGEFGRTVYCQGRLTTDDYGRDHHPRCFTIWMAGGGVKPGFTYGTTDDFSYNTIENPVDVHDLHATILHQLGIDHTQLTYKFQGRHYRLTDVHGNVVKEILS